MTEDDIVAIVNDVMGEAVVVLRSAMRGNPKLSETLTFGDGESFISDVAVRYAALVRLRLRQELVP